MVFPVLFGMFALYLLCGRQQTLLKEVFILLIRSFLLTTAFYYCYETRKMKSLKNSGNFQK